MSTPTTQLDADALAEIAARDFGIDSMVFPVECVGGGEVCANAFAKGDKVVIAKSRNRRPDAVVGFVVKQTSPERADIFWPDVQTVVSTRIKKLRRVA
jgi:hypothetical protein